MHEQLRADLRQAVNRGKQTGSRFVPDRTRPF